MQIPHARFIDLLTYKAALVGIQVLLTEESYTSQASFLDRDPLPIYDPAREEHPRFSGRRDGRWYRASGNRLIHSDVNGAYNIGRKVVPTAFGLGIGAAAVRPRRLAALKRGSWHPMSWVLILYDTPSNEEDACVRVVRETLATGLRPEEMEVIAHWTATHSLCKFVDHWGLPNTSIDGTPPRRAGIHLVTMHRAKGLEFRAAFIVGCSAETLPQPYTGDEEDAVARAVCSTWR